MSLENLTLKDLGKLTEMLSNKSQPDSYNEDNGKIKIVILQGGWVMIGRFYQDEHYCTLKDGYTIRQWGTSEGLGELAEKGALEKTILDKNPEVKFHELTVVAALLCDEKAWKKHFK